MGRPTTAKVLYFKKILATHLRTNYPDARMSDREATHRAYVATALYDRRHSLPIAEVMKLQLAVLFDGYPDNDNTM